MASLLSNEPDKKFGGLLARLNFRRFQIRKFLIIALGLLAAFAATDTASASSSSSLHTFKALCDARDGYFGIVDHQAVCQLPTGKILTMSRDYDSYDYDRSPPLSLSFSFDHKHHCKPLKEQMMLSGSGDCRDRMPIKSLPIETGKPVLKGLYHR